MSGQRRSSTSIEPPRAELTSGTVIGGDAARHQFHSRVTPIWRRTARTRDRLPLGVVSNNVVHSGFLGKNGRYHTFRSIREETPSETPS